jgi:hypothetical protein
MLSMLPLLTADLTLPEDVRRALRGSPDERVRALLRLGLTCGEAAELAGAETTSFLESCA